jgi:FkbH-like protein
MQLVENKNWQSTDITYLLKNLRKDFIAKNTFRLAVLADSASQFVAKSIRGIGIECATCYDIFEADYNQIDLQVFYERSELYQFKPDFVLILRSTEKLVKQFYATEMSKRPGFAEAQAEYVQKLHLEIRKSLKCKVIINTFPELDDAVFGNFCSKTKSSFPYQVKKANLELMDLSQQEKDLFLLRLDAIVNNIGYSKGFDPKMYVTADMVFGFDLLPTLAKNVHDIIQAIHGNFKKCLILDLDNTLWGGVIGDDGVEGVQMGELGIGKLYTDLQLWAKELKKRGIVLAVCSKNNDEIAKEPFERHPDIKLRLTDIAVFVANWETKVDNIIHIQKLLNIGFDSMVFLDDNPFEREMVKSSIPGITVPDLPEDPAEYVSYLRSLNLFETASFTEEDEARTSQYQKEFKRLEFQQSFADEQSYLASLEMVATVEPFNEFTAPRVAQLSQRSNQFNLRTIRYTEEDIKAIATSDRYLTLSFRLSDKFGDHGLIAYVILERKNNETLFINSWVMSCRVLKRGMEEFTLHCLVELALKEGFRELEGQYIPTSKNILVKDHYATLGFTTSKEGNWKLTTTEQQKLSDIFIDKK